METAAGTTPLGTRTHCPYCAFQCGMVLRGTTGQPEVDGDNAFPVNKGALCIKGWTAAATLGHEDRLLTPLARNSGGALTPVSWEDALGRIARAFQQAQSRYGHDAVGVFGGGSLTNEKAYLLGKFARVALGTSNVDYNGRFCMSSAAAAGIRAFGVDRGLPFPLEDIPHAEVVLLAGGNPAETMPPMMQYFQAQRANGGRLIAVDPRRSLTAESADIHLRLAPGSDIALVNGLLHVLLRDGLLDTEYIRQQTEGFAEVRGVAASYWPERVEQVTGIPVSTLTRAAHLLGNAGSAMVLTGRGPEQQSQGVNNALAYINLALALGLPGRPNSGYGCLTGQGNGQGGREHGQKADQLPGYRRIDDPAARRHVAQVWGVPEADLPGLGLSAYEMLESCGREGGVRALLVMGSNVVVSAPNALQVEDHLKSLDFLAVADFFPSETALLADVVLPAAQWAEEEGTMTNLEGRVVLRRRAFLPPPEVRTDLEVFGGLAATLGKGESFAFEGAAQVFQELCRASAGGVADYSGMSYEKIAAQEGVFWPCPGPSHPGTPRLFQSGFPTPSGKARFHPVRHVAPAEEPDEGFPLYLTTGRVLAQYQSGAQTRRIPQLLELGPEPLAEVHPATARRYGLSDGGMAALTTRRGAATFQVKVTPGIREDTVFVPFHWSGVQAINRLTNPALDPVSRMPEFKVCAVRIGPVTAS